MKKQSSRKVYTWNVSFLIQKIKLIKNNWATNVVYDNLIKLNSLLVIQVNKKCKLMLKKLKVFWFCESVNYWHLFDVILNWQLKI